MRLVDETHLKRMLQSDIAGTTKQKIVFLAGHAPLFYDEEKAYVASQAWGAFTLYSLDIACQVARLCKEQGEPKEISLILLVDDINYDDTVQNRQVSRDRKARLRDRFYRSMSGVGAVLPSEFYKVLTENQIPVSNVVRADHGKEGRADCLFFSERSLRAARAQTAQNECAQAYKSLINSPAFDMRRDYLVAFLPDRCTGNICDAVLDERRKSGDTSLSATHISMQTDNTLLGMTDVASIWTDWGVQYRKDN